MIINDLYNNKKFVAEDIGDLGYNVVRYYEKTQEVKKLTNWLEKEAGLPRNSPLYFDDVDLVYGNKTIVPGALINPKLTFNDLLTAVVQASKQGMAEATGDEKFDTMMGQIQREPKYPDSQMPPTDVKDLYNWAVENNKLYHEIFAEWANREGYKSVAPALQRAGDLDTEALDYWTPRVWKIYWGEVRGIDSEMPPEWAKKRVPDELRDYLETVFDAYNRIVFDWPTEYRQIGMAEAIGDLGSKRDIGKSVRKWRKSRGLDETGQGPVTHRIGLTVTDPNHPMVSKRKEQYQKSVRVTGPNREAAINQAIAHYRRKGYKVHDHHYLGTVDQGMAEGWKDKLGAAALAGSMALGAGAAHSRVTPDGQGGFTGGLKPSATVTAPVDNKPAAEAPKGFSKEYLQKAADPNRVGRYLISVEKAQELLKGMQEGVTEGMAGKVVFSGTGDDGGKYEVIQSGPNDYMIHANGRHIDTYGSLQRAMSVLQNEVPGLQQGMAEGPVTKKPQPYNDPDWIKKLPKDQLDALGGKRYSKDKKPVSEVSLGNYREKAAVSQAGAKIKKFFGRDDSAEVAAADQTIAKRERGLARADARVKAYVPPQAEPADLEKQQRDLTAKYPNIDELVRRAELNRDPDYEMADGQAYYAARDAEQNYQKLRQIQRVIQGLNESLNRSHLP